MPWTSVSVMSQRKEFVELVRTKSAPMSVLCRRFGISRPTGYKWVRRGARDGDAGLVDLPTRPHHSPRRTQEALETAVLTIRRAHPQWGGRMIARLLREGGMADVPAPSTITGILRRNGLIDPAEADTHRPWQRFEHAQPNDLWQMDFKGHFALSDGMTRCHPLTMLDDHSRFSLTIRAAGVETHAVVYHELVRVFRQYGMPLCILSDNGPPWGTPGVSHGYTQLNIWLIRLGIRISHGAPYHPQTQGKAERFHRTLNAEVIRGRQFGSFADCQQAFDEWREIYNCVRPHQALEMKTPVTRYRVSPRSYPEQLPPIEYGPEDIVRRVQGKGDINFNGQIYVIGKAFRGQPVALRPTNIDGIFEVFYCQQCIKKIDERIKHNQNKV